MEVVKNIAAVLGVILSAASVLALVSKTVRSAVARLFHRYGNTDEITESITEIKTLLERHIEEGKEFKENITETNNITMEFTRTQCRNIIKNIFYKYNDTKVLPLYEKKTLKYIEELYIDKLHGNSFASLLLDEMSDWEVDYESAHSEED